MNLILLILSCILVATFACIIYGALTWGVINADPNAIRDSILLILVCAIAITAVCVCSISSYTTDERRFIESYNAQKIVLEAALESDDLTGMERFEIVKDIASLNGQLASRKVTYERWYNIYSDDTLYDNVEFIEIN